MICNPLITFIVIGQLNKYKIKYQFITISILNKSMNLILFFTKDINWGFKNITNSVVFNSNPTSVSSYMIITNLIF